MKTILAIIFTLGTMCHAGGIEKDKQLHFVVGAAIGSFVTYRCEVEDIKHPRLWGFLAATAVGLLKEMSDRKEPGNKFDGIDLAFTSAGGFSGAQGAHYVFEWKFRF